MEDVASLIVTFSEGKGQIAVPNGYDVSLGEGGDLQLLELTAKKLRVYATFHDLNGYGRNDAGEVVVLSHAQKKQSATHADGRPDRTRPTGQSHRRR